MRGLRVMNELLCNIQNNNFYCVYELNTAINKLHVSININKLNVSINKLHRGIKDCQTNGFFVRMTGI